MGQVSLRKELKTAGRLRGAHALLGSPRGSVRSRCCSSFQESLPRRAGIQGLAGIDGTMRRVEFGEKKQQFWFVQHREPGEQPRRGREPF